MYTYKLRINQIILNVFVPIATKTSASKSIRSQQTVDSHRGPSSTRHSDLQTHGNNNLPLSPEGKS